MHALIAFGVNGDGGGEALGLEVASREDGVGWLGFPRSLTDRGLSGVRMVSPTRVAAWSRRSGAAPARRGVAGLRVHRNLSISDLS